MSLQTVIHQNNRITQAWICLALILANFLAQVLYYLHLYAGRMPLALEIRGSLVMGSVFTLFLAGAVLFLKRQAAGYWLLIPFLTVEFLFYLYNTIGAVVHGYGLFFQVFNPDLTLRIVFSIGYLNFFASGYFLYLLLRNREAFIPTSF
jgi:hypothetical protein